jgi:hypothetical protein
MIVEHFYHGYRIEVYAERTGNYWDATVRIRRVLQDDKPHVDRVTCQTLTADLAEMNAAMWARPVGGPQRIRRGLAT